MPWPRPPCSLALGILLIAASGCGKSQAGSAAAGPPHHSCPSTGALAEALGPIALTGPRMVRLNAVCTAEAMTARLRSFGKGTRFILVADDLRAGVQPGALFRLSVGPPTAGQATVIGTINFYGAQPPSGEGQPHSISFDVTGQILSLAIAGWPAQGVGVAVAPSGPIAPGANATVGAIRLVAQAPR